MAALAAGGIQPKTASISKFDDLRIDTPPFPA
jgi:hypothetical protein